jgi:PAS domain S-box-containing protein
MTLAHADTHAGSRSFRALAALDQEAMDALPQAIYLCADDGRMLRFNRKAAELWGRTPSLSDPGERFCGSVRLYRIDGALLPHDQCPMAAALQTGESFLDKEVVIEQPSGKRLTVLVNIVALKSKDGRISGAVNCFQDITDRKHWEDRSRTLIEDLLRTQQALRDSEQRLRDMIDALPAAIYTTDTEGRVTHFNPAAATLSGRTPDLGTDRWCVTWKLYRPDGSALQHEDCPMAVALKEGRAIRGEEIIAERPDGTRAWVTPYPTPLKDADGNIIGGINMLVDITARRAAEEHLRLMMSCKP